MAKIKINDEYTINGILQVRRYIDENGQVFVEGSFSCHYYFEEINTLESLRYKVTGINVKEELFSSEDFNITYNFEAKSIENVYDLSDLSTEDIINAEKLIYGEKGYVLNTVLDQYFTNKDKKKKEDGDNNE